MTTNTEATKAGDLLPCPFCGSKTLYVKHEPGTSLPPAYYVHCDDCGAQSGAWERGEHIEEWNRRATPSAEPASAAPAIDVTPEMVEKGCVAEIEHQKLPLDCRHYMRRANRIKAILEGALMGDPPMDVEPEHFDSQPIVEVASSDAPDPAQSADTPSEALTFDAFRAANVARCLKGHPAGVELWSPSDWLTAVTGELGEFASLLKMRNLERDGLIGNKFSPTRKQIADEIADVVTYLDLLAYVLGVDLGRAAATKFNEVSERVGFPDRIALAHAQSADTPSEAPVAWQRRCDGGEWLQCSREQYVHTVRRGNAGVVGDNAEARALYALRPQPARGEVSEAEVDAALQAEKDFDDRPFPARRITKNRIRAALEAAARVRAGG